MSSDTFGSEGAKQVDKVHKALDEEVDQSGGSEGWRESEGEVKRAGRGSVAEREGKGGEAHSSSLNAAVRCVPATEGPHTALQPCLPPRSTRSESKMAGARNT